MATLPELQVLREQLLSARGAPEQRIRFRQGDQEEDVTYRTDSELAAALRDVERRIALASGTKITTIRLSTSKGI